MRPSPHAVLYILTLLAGCNGCTSTGSVSPAVVPSVNLGVCVLVQYATDPQCRKGGDAVKCIGDVATACGSEAQSVANLLDAHTRAMVADGYVPTPDAGK